MVRVRPKLKMRIGGRLGNVLRIVLGLGLG